MVLFRQMQKEFLEIRKRRAQAQMDNILRQRRERKSLKPQATVTASDFQLFFPLIPPQFQTILAKVMLPRIFGSGD
jgi:hypothetical protein